MDVCAVRSVIGTFITLIIGLVRCFCLTPERLEETEDWRSVIMWSLVHAGTVFHADELLVMYAL